MFMKLSYCVMYLPTFQLDYHTLVLCTPQFILLHPCFLGKCFILLLYSWHTLVGITQDNVI